MEITLFYTISGMDEATPSAKAFTTQWTETEYAVYQSYLNSHPEAVTVPNTSQEGFLPIAILEEIVPEWLQQQTGYIIEEQNNLLNENNEFDEFTSDEEIYEEEEEDDNEERNDQSEVQEDVSFDTISLIGFKL